MKKTIKRCIITLITFLILTILICLIFAFAIFKGWIMTRNVNQVLDEICVTLELTKGKNTEAVDDDELLCTNGFFIAPDRVVCLTAHYLDSYDICILDSESNEYKIIDSRSNNNVTILKTDKPNKKMNSILPQTVSTNDIVKTHISKSQDIMDLTDCKVLINDCGYEGAEIMMCEGKIEGMVGYPVLNQYGRLVGITFANRDGENSFYAYTLLEIFKMDLKMAFGIYDW